MTFAAILPRFPYAFPWPRLARRPSRAAIVAPPRQFPLAVRTIVKLENRCLQLRVLSGSIWITRDGCPADTVLCAGDVFDQRPGAPVLVQALETSELSIADAPVGPQNA
jgi:hypothetical protein